MAMQKRSGGGGGRGRSGGRGAKAATGDKAQAQRRGGLFRRRKENVYLSTYHGQVDYVKLLQPFVPERGKILPRRISGTCAMHQRKLRTAIMRARVIALLPYVTD